MKDLPTSPLAPASFPDLPIIAGMEASATRLGLYGGERNDLLVVHFPKEATVAGAFTTSATRSADVDWCADKVKGGTARVLVVNAGNSNAFTGPAGVAKNAATAEMASEWVLCGSEQVFMAATGVIGVPLPVNLVADGLPHAFNSLTAPKWEALAGAISTTDTFSKGSGKVIDLDGHSVSISGIAKGSGMIAPNMATMLVFVFTDAAIDATLLQSMIDQHVQTTFNSITVDSDTSTSDTLLVFATGTTSAKRISSDTDPRAKVFSQALLAVFHDLALQVVRDGEGAQKLIQICVTGAESEKSARAIGMAVANSPLVKTAIAGEDANWGRVVMAVGKSGEPIDMDALSVRFGGVWTAKDGGAIAYDSGRVDAHMKEAFIDILIDVGTGPGFATVWTCDLTHGYISINGDYRS
jgi:glutamate N-acetyltransferase / amino-acid N-acetyltransferase